MEKQSLFAFLLIGSSFLLIALIAHNVIAKTSDEFPSVTDIYISRTMGNGRPVITTYLIEIKPRLYYLPLLLKQVTISPTSILPIPLEKED